MTEQLRTLMDRAASQDFAAVDLEAITAAGDRTVRRRQVATGVAGVAVLAAVATGAALFGGGDGDRKTDFVDDPFPTDVPMWTEGSTLHTPDRIFDLGVDVVSFVRTSEGVVFLGWEGKEPFGVYSFTGEGEPERIGASEDTRLRADPSESYVGWLDGADQGGPRTVVYDQRTGERVWTDATGGGQDYSFPLVAIDGDTAYLSEDAGPTRSVNLVSGESTTVPGLDDNQHLVAIEGDLAAYVDEEVEESTGLIVGPLEAGGVQLPGSDGAIFSPGGHWISVFGEQLNVYDAASGERVDIDTAGYANGLGYEWIDPETLLAIAGSTEELVLLECDVTADNCDVVARLGGPEEDKIFAIGFGEAMWAAGGTSSQSAEVTSTVEAPPESSSTERPE